MLIEIDLDGMINDLAKRLGVTPDADGIRQVRDAMETISRRVNERAEELYKEALDRGFNGGQEAAHKRMAALCEMIGVLDEPNVGEFESGWHRCGQALHRTIERLKPLARKPS